MSLPCPAFDPVLIQRHFLALHNKSVSVNSLRCDKAFNTVRARAFYMADWTLPKDPFAGSRTS